MSAIEPLSIKHLHPVRDVAARSFSRLWAPQDFAYFLAHDFRLAVGIFGGKPSSHLQAYFLGLVIQGDLDVISIATEPEARRRGLARELLQHAIAQPEVARAFLEVAVDNTGAIALYEKLGFAPVSRRRGYYENRIDALVLRWERK